MLYDCSISYAPADVQLAAEVERRLSEAGFRVGRDTLRLEANPPWEELARATREQARVVLPLLTPTWHQLEWTRLETYGAEAVIPLLTAGGFEDLAPGPLRGLRGSCLDLNTASWEDWELVFATVREVLSAPPPNADEQGKTRIVGPDAPHWFGRQRELAQLHEALQDAPLVVLTVANADEASGASTSGSTTLARMYVDHFWRCYRQIIWVDSGLGIEAELARASEHVLPAQWRERLESAQEPEKARRLLLELENRLGGPRLLIFDNAEDEAALSPWLPKRSLTKTLVTSRSRGWKSAKTMSMGPLDVEAARQMLVERAGRGSWAEMTPEESAACTALAEALAPHPLSLAQAAAFVGQQAASEGFHEYWQRYARAAQAGSGLQNGQAVKLPAPVEITWQLCRQQQSAMGQALLQMASLLAPTGFPEQLLIDASASLAGVMGRSGETPDVSAQQAREAVRRLRDYGLLMPAAGGHVELPGLVRTLERARVSLEETMHWAMAAISGFMEHAPQVLDSPAAAQQWDTLYPHAQALYEISHYCGAVPIKASLLEQMSQYQVSLGRYETALPIARELLAQDDSAFGPDHPDTLASMSGLALVLMNVSQFAEAERLYRHVLEVQERDLGPDHEETLISAEDLGNALETQGKYDAAEAVFRRVLESRQRTLGTDDPATLDSLAALGLLLVAKYNLTDAEPLLRQALEVRERVLGADDFDTLASAVALAGCYDTKGDYAAAEPLYRRVLQAYQQRLGPYHPDTLASLNNLGLMYFSKWDITAAEPLLREALETREWVLGPEHPDTITSVNNLALLIESQGNFTAVEPLYRRALEVSRRVLGPEHPDTLSSANNLGMYYSNKLDFGMAEPLLRNALEGRRRVLGPEHPDTLSSANNLAGLLESRGDYASSEPLYRLALEGLERHLGTDHANTRICRGNWLRCRDLFEQQRRVAPRRRWQFWR